MRNGEDAQLLANNGVDDAVWEPSCAPPTFSVTPHRPEQGMLEKKIDGALKLRKKGLGEGEAGPVLVELSCFP